MNGQEFENKLQQLFAEDLAAGTDAFRDNLLTRCLSVLGTDNAAAGDIGSIHELSDADLELLAAAGDASFLENSSRIFNNGTPAD